ncbi:MAG: V-type ATP synthase subunit D [Candidatus Marinimicrobia bacterium]|nr:V-type ATP synthase subunit D [Candidatus Neomarinimicrobiota bacterium]
MAKIKLTKNELKKQRDALKRYTRYLPTLELKKQQLLAEIRRVQDEVRDRQIKMDAIEKHLALWVAVFAEDIDITSLFFVKKIHIDNGNIAGIDIPLFKGIDFEEKAYDYMTYPLWVDAGIEISKKFISLNKELEILHQQETLIQEELRITIQRINLFDKVMIPRSKESIRKIRIFMGDQDTAAVVRGKISKSKIEKKKRNKSVRLEKVYT